MIYRIKVRLKMAGVWLLRESSALVLKGLDALRRRPQFCVWSEVAPSIWERACGGDIKVGAVPSVCPQCKRQVQHFPAGAQW